uniref:Fructose-bisphosphatase n=2 Tax=Ditylum brightwellii TaxID=49249 RepID=A0A7S1ZSA7_9STRA
MDFHKTKEVVTKRETTLSRILTSKEHGVTDERLVHAIVALGEATANISGILSNYVNHTYAGTQNSSGDDQLKLDIDCDNAVFEAIRSSGVYAIAASEETPVETDVSSTSSTPSSSPNNKEAKEEGEESVFSLGFDPLDGSSIIDANFSVGSIFGIWPGKGVLNRTGREQIASAVAIYGPRTTLCIALPTSPHVSPEKKSCVFEVTLTNNYTTWEVSKEDIKLEPSGKVFAPGNLRATNDNENYNSLIQHYITDRYTLRYTGGMVPDVYHIFTKKKGVFTNVSSEKAKAKLRVLYEVAPLGLMVECAGGMTTHESEDGSVLDLVINDLDRRCGVCFGSVEEVKKYKEFMFK